MPKRKPAYSATKTPLPLSKFRYTGRSDEDFTNDDVYTIIDSGNHWDGTSGFGLWITYNGYRPVVPSLNDYDEDYACFIPLDYFVKYFKPATH